MESSPLSTDTITEASYTDNSNISTRCLPKKLAPSVRGEFQARNPILITEHCISPNCTGLYYDIFGTFSVICKDQRHIHKQEIE